MSEQEVAKYSPDGIEKEKKINWGKLDTKIEYHGRAITLPEDPGKMPIKEARKALERLEADQEQIVRVHEIIDAYPLDAAVAFVKAMKKLYGWASPASTPGFFGPQPPEFISVKIGKNKEDVLQCPLGAFKLPNVEQLVQTLISPLKRGGPQFFIIHAEIPQKHKDILLELATETRYFVENESIYRGKAIRLQVDINGNLDMNTPPEFMDTSSISEGSLVFSDEIMGQIQTNILVPLKYPKRCRDYKIPPKRGILLEGPYGTGKSLTAAMVARVCEDNGVTFILLDKVQGLKAALELAIRFGRSVVFAEDIDRIATERDEKANDLINTIDGVVSKNSPVMTILTTNHADKLNPVILRPGRLDAVISLRAPDAPTVKKLIKHYAGELLPPDHVLDKSSKELAGQIPATIRECVERAKLGMIGREADHIGDTDLHIAALSMKAHLALLNKDQEKPSNAEILADSLRKAIVNEQTIEQLAEAAE